MSSIDQKEYLKRYLSGGDTEEKKKKKRRKKRPENAAPVKLTRSVLVDDDVDVRALAIKEEDNEKAALLEEADEAPLVAAFVDERPEEVVKLEEFRKSDKWKTLGNDEGEQSKSQGSKGFSSVRDRSRHDSSSDASPPRIRNRHDSDSDLSPPRPGCTAPIQRKRHDSSSDASPPRRNAAPNHKQSNSSQQRHDSDSDLSPPRTSSIHPRAHNDSDSDMSPPRKRTDKPNDRAEKGRRSRHDSDSDLSPPRGRRDRVHGNRERRGSEDLSPPRKRANIRNDMRGGGRSGRRHDLDSDLSPPREKKWSRQRKDGDIQSRGSKSRTRANDSDISPPRRSKEELPKDRKSRHDSDSDLSPPRIQRSKGNDRSRRQGGSDSDLSPPRGQRSKDNARSRRRRGSDSDLSPPRKGRMDSDSDLSPDRGNSQKTSKAAKPTKTLAGAKAGLSDAATLRRENEATRKRTSDAYSTLADDVSGRNAETVFRDKSGKRRDLKAEKRLKKEEEAKQAEEDEKFMQWGKGVKQMKQQQDKVEDALKEMAKPLARYKDDQDLDQMLKEKDREGDPMLAFLKKKESSAMAKAGIKEKPKYRGPKPAPNRFGILPGYRWDGVDRSNGFEKKYFMRISDKKATSEVAYLWSIEDM